MLTTAYCVRPDKHTYVIPSAFGVLIMGIEMKKKFSSHTLL